MIDEHLDLTTADGQMNTFVTHPEKGGPHPVVLPNLYYRSTREFDATADFATHGEQMGKLMFSLGYGMIRRDTEAMLGFVDAAPPPTLRDSAPSATA